MIFVDTGAWFATIVEADPDHEAALHWLGQNSEPLLTTDYVVDETLTLLKARGLPRRAIQAGEQFFSGELATVHHLTPTDLQTAWEVFRKYADKDWSFTDCTCKVVMEKLQIAVAFAFDQHFRQFGSIQVVP